MNEFTNYLISIRRKVFQSVKMVGKPGIYLRCFCYIRCKFVAKQIRPMKSLLLFVSLSLLTLSSTFAQSAEEQTLIQLSMDKWQWMSDKDVDKLDKLFDAKAKFVHMSGTWKKDEELDIIKTGRIWYKKATVKDTAVEISGNTAIVWNRITLDAVVREQVAVTEFTVTEVYQKQGKEWKMLALTFSSVRDTHQIKH